MEKKRILTAMSGGVDSSAAAALLLEDGWEAAGATMRLCGGPQAELMAAACARAMGMEHMTFDLREEFSKLVIKDFIDVYCAGGTPNPCAVCNKTVKFGLFLQKALELGYDAMATGHYAKTEASGSRVLLKKADYLPKDQSYFLYGLTQEQLRRSVFPLGAFTKADARRIAAERNLPSASGRESQDICFVPDGDYAAFIESALGRTFPPGDFLNAAGETVGRHQGLIRYTVGQRRGLRLAMGEPVYVKSKDAVKNTVTVAADGELYSTRLAAGNVNFIAVEGLSAPARLKARIRYRHTEQWAAVEQTGPDTVSVVFDSPQRAAAAGQAVVFYDGDVVVGGGTIL